jgi:hypothetical protein
MFLGTVAVACFSCAIPIMGKSNADNKKRFMLEVLVDGGKIKK